MFEMTMIIGFIATMASAIICTTVKERTETRAKIETSKAYISGYKEGLAKGKKIHFEM